MLHGTWRIVAAFGVFAAVAASVSMRAVAATSDDLVFIHHSCGANWLSNSLHSALLAKDYIDERNDIYYGTDVANDSGRPDSLAPYPGNSTNMNHWIKWLNDYVDHVKDHATATGVNRIIMFKSCYPISNVTSAGTGIGDPFSSTQTLVNYKAVYRHASGPGNTYSSGGHAYKPLEDIFAENPDALFVPVTAPPLCNSATTDPNAHRARLFNNWLKTTWIDSYNAANPGLNNVAVFNWFDVLANPDDHATWPNRLKAAYGGTTTNSHPNSTGNAYSTQVYATNTKNFIDEAFYRFAYEPGDSSLDGKVDGTDLADWQTCYDPLGLNADLNRWVTCDWNDDGNVDGGDLALWQQNYDPLGGTGAAVDAIPEPATLTMVVAGILGVLAGRRARR